MVGCVAAVSVDDSVRDEAHCLFGEGEAGDDCGSDVCGTAARNELVSTVSEV